MKKLSIKEIINKLAEIYDVNDPFLIEAKHDERKGVQQALYQWYKRQEQQQMAEQRFADMSEYEKKARKEGFNLIAGVDEVGRGPLAGPVVAAAVILPESFKLLGLDDSKKLSESKREAYAAYIRNEALAIGIGIVSAEEIDAINIYEATKKAMQMAISKLSIEPQQLLIDAMKIETPYRVESIVKGDAKSISIAAASVIAKVTRDEMMKRLAQSYPQYHFDKNMGYGTKEHLLAIEQYGITPFHRKSFAPICNMK